MHLHYARAAAQAGEEKLAEDLALLDVRGVSNVTDYFLIMGANSHLHVRALEDAVRESLRRAGARLLRTDGQRGHLWRVLDFGGLIVHIMEKKTREFYSIERLWNAGKPISWRADAPPKQRKRKPKTSPRKPSKRKNDSRRNKKTRTTKNR